MTEEIDFSNIQLNVSKDGVQRNAYIYISSAMNETGLEGGYEVCDICLVASRETKGAWKIIFRDDMHHLVRSRRCYCT